MTDEAIRVEARLAWWLVFAGVILFLGALFWGFMDPHVGMMANTTTDITNGTTTDTGSEAAFQTGLSRVQILWNYWPLWFTMALLYGGYRRAINESKQFPGR